MGEVTSMPALRGTVSTTTSEVRRGPRLSAVLARSYMRTFDDFVVLPSNAQAVESAMLFGTGRTPFVALVGPSGWGKSHLVEAATSAMEAAHGIRAQVVDAKEWANVGLRVDPFAPLVIDNVQEGAAQHKTRVQLQLTLERRVRSGRPTLVAFTAAKPTRPLRAFLPNHHAWIVATIDGPTASERLRVVAQMARAESLSLSEPLQRILAIHLNGNGRTLEGACKRLRLQDSCWLDSRASLRALGLLNPFFVDNSDWDLREEIATAAESRCRTDWNRELAIYTMLRVAFLAEADVAHYYEVEPSVAYACASRFQKRIDSSDDVAELTRKFAEDVVARLGSEGP